MRKDRLAVVNKMIDNPILNRPYKEPGRHFAFDDEGITDRVEGFRRPSSFFVPVPRPRKGPRQLELAELTADQIRLNDQYARPGQHGANPDNQDRDESMPHPAARPRIVYRGQRREQVDRDRNRLRGPDLVDNTKDWRRWAGGYGSRSGDRAGLGTVMIPNGAVSAPHLPHQPR